MNHPLPGFRTFCAKPRRNDLSANFIGIVGCIFSMSEKKAYRPEPERAESDMRDDLIFSAESCGYFVFLNPDVSAQIERNNTHAWHSQFSSGHFSPQWKRKSRQS